MKKFNSPNYVKSWLNKHAVLNVITIILGIILVVYNFSLLDEIYNKDEKNLCYFLILILSACVVTAIFQNSKFAALQGNLLKNYLEINDNYISGIYTEKPKIADNDKYFKIGYNQIEKIEVKEPNFIMQEFHNLYIYHSGELIKLAIESPEQARTLILGHTRGAANQLYACACGNNVFFGQEKCEKCGRKFDWTKI